MEIIEAIMKGIEAETRRRVLFGTDSDDAYQKALSDTYEAENEIATAIKKKLYK